MDWKRGFGIGLIFFGMIIILTSKVITGAVIGFRPSNFLGLFGFLVFVMGIFLVLTQNLESRLEVPGLSKDKIGKLEVDSSAHSVINYIKLNNRLKDMESKGLRGVSSDMIAGRFLTHEEELKIYKTVINNLPDDVRESDDLEISITGSLSRNKEGKRDSGKYGIEGHTYSDQFNLM